MSVVALFCGPAVVIGTGVAFVTWSAQPFALRREVRSRVKTGLAACYDFFSD
jgi:hypothetical protein